MPSSQYFTNPPPPAPAQSGQNTSNAFMCASQADMLGSHSADNDICIRTDLNNQCFVLVDAPANVLANWIAIKDPAAAAAATAAAAAQSTANTANNTATSASFAASNAAATANTASTNAANALAIASAAPSVSPINPTAPKVNQLWKNGSLGTIAGVPAQATAVWTGTAWQVVSDSAAAPVTTLYHGSATIDFGSTNPPTPAVSGQNSQGNEPFNGLKIKPIVLIGPNSASPFWANDPITGEFKFTAAAVGKKFSIGLGIESALVSGVPATTPIGGSTAIFIMGLRGNGGTTFASSQDLKTKKEILVPFTTFFPNQTIAENLSATFVVVAAGAALSVFSDSFAGINLQFNARCYLSLIALN